MKRFLPLATSFSAAAFASAVFAANEPVLVEAETGARGADLIANATGGVGFIETIATGAGQNPAAAARVATYNIAFPEPGDYLLYARVYVGPDAGNDDSFFYGNGFGLKDPADAAHWITVNQLGTAVGYTQDGDEVDGGGVAVNGVWKWIRLSSFNAEEPGISFAVPDGSLTQAFQIGSREDGLRLDRFAFGKSGVFYTVAQLDGGLPGSTTSASDPYEPMGLPIAQGNPKRLGSVHSPDHAINFARYWNQVTPENAGKWGSVEGARDAMNWTQLDDAYALARDNGFPFRMHVLVWGNQQPSWIESLPPAEQIEEIEEWFAAVAARYPDIDYLEVVNEFENDPPDGPGDGNYIAALGGAGASGYDWIRNAFRLARKHFPDTPLMLNEYNVVNSAARVQRYLNLVEILKAENLIQVLGIQCHAFSTRGVPAGTLRANLDLLATAGLPIWVTELDIDGLDDQVQLSEYQRVFPVLWEHPAVIGVTLWGYRPQHWRAAQGAYIAYSNGVERPALSWLREYVVGEGPATFNRFLLDRQLSHDEHTPDSDLDGDALSAAFEYMLGTDPAAPGAPPMRFAIEGGAGQYRFPTDPENVEGYLAIDASADLVDWSEVAAIAWPIEPEAFVEVGLPAPEAGASVFYRARFQLEAPPIDP